MGQMRVRKYLQTFVLAVLAGIAIGIGGIGYLSLENKVAGALLFTVGLYTICAHGLNLFTGKVGYLVQQELSVLPGYLMDLAVIWAGNLAGTFFTAYAVLETRICGISQAAEALCTTKTQDSFQSLFLLALFCGFLMFAAVDGYKTTKHPAVLFTGVAAFILCGFEHCVADMFYFSIAGAWSAHSLLCMLVITAGNAAGGMLIPLCKKI